METNRLSSQINKLQSHALLTISEIEKFFKRRGWTTGLKKWEQILLFSAYEALETPYAERKFDMDKIKDVNKIEKRGIN